MKKQMQAIVGVVVLWGAVSSAHAYDISGWTINGNAGSGTAAAIGGVVTAPADGPSYAWISTDGGVTQGGFGVGSETNGTTAVSPVFNATAGQILAFNFNFVTSDGAGFSDYAWVRLLDSADNEIAVLFSARTAPSGDIVPGFGLPATHAATTLIPATTPIISGAPVWQPLGGNSNNSCYAAGCGYTGWVRSNFVVPATGSYKLELGILNYADTAFDSGLAFSGVTIGGTAIGGGGNSISPVPVFNMMGLLLAVAGVGGFAAQRLRKEKQQG